MFVEFGTHEGGGGERVSLYLHNGDGGGDNYDERDQQKVVSFTL
jgi:hypothetical protein